MANINKKTIFPPKLETGDEIRVIAPSSSAGFLSSEIKSVCISNLNKLGINVSFGNNIYVSDILDSTSVSQKLEDIYDAFSNPKIKGIIAIRGGYNSNTILDDIDWTIITKNPKIFCGFSDITVLCNAIYAKTGLVTYHTPNFSTFGQKKYISYSLDYFKKCLFNGNVYEINSSKYWSQDEWWSNQEHRKLEPNNGIKIINKGTSKIIEGLTLGGNLSSLNLLQGTKYMPDLRKSVLFLEDDDLVDAKIFERYIESLIQQKSFDGIKALLLGRFQRGSMITIKQLETIFKTKKQLQNVCIMANLDFGHTDPQISFPIGGKARIEIVNNIPKITITSH
ncbi:MAG: S66 peptidase family protein [Patescibacteria group bacterium]